MKGNVMSSKCKVTHTLVTGALDKWKFWQTFRKDRKRSTTVNTIFVYVQKVLLKMLDFSMSI